jgi:intraflagellar transport protein 140
MASQMFTRLGDKVKTMKALINLGDFNKVITYANNARVPEIYILAANFLQTADWHQNGQLVTTIISFYK